MRWIAKSHVHTCVLGTYEPETQKTLVEFVRPASTVWDVGACCGYLTMLAAALTGPTGRVVAIEPNPVAVDYLRRHTELNQLENVTVVNQAVSDRAGTMQFETRDYIGFCRLSADGDLTAQTITLDELLHEYPGPDVLKIDVEGAECAVLVGARRLLATRPVLLLSTHGRDNFEQCRAVLAGSGYRFVEHELKVGRRFDHLAEVLAVPSS